jgi:hypothetical protein
MSTAKRWFCPECDTEMPSPLPRCRECGWTRDGFESCTVHNCFICDEHGVHHEEVDPQASGHEVPTPRSKPNLEEIGGLFSDASEDSSPPPILDLRSPPNLRLLAAVLKNAKQAQMLYRQGIRYDPVDQ